MQTDDAAKPAVSRRAVVTGAGAVATAAALAAATGCATYGQSSDTATTAGGGGTAGAAAAALAKTSEIPVGSGKVFKDQKVVVTQATAGKFAAFSSVCTHQGCDVNEVAGGTINCPCHGSKYKLDGSVAEGPATRPLPAKKATVTGDSISVT